MKAASFYGNIKWLHGYMLGTRVIEQSAGKSSLDPSETKRHAPETDEDIVHRIKEVMSEIPCRVSSDLQEWHNDLRTVLTRDSVKLQYR